MNAAPPNSTPNARRPASVTAALILILVNALIWLAFGIVVASGAHPALLQEALLRWAMAAAAVACAIGLAALAFFLARRSKIAYYSSVGLLAAVAALTVMDEFGLADLPGLLVTLAALALLASSRHWYLRAS